MTREKAIRLLTTKRAQPSTDYQMAEVYTMAIQALSQEPCDNTISREDRLIDLANAIESDDSGYWTNKRISSALRNIPPVTQKSGKWIDYRDDGFVECPFCGHATNCEDDIDELHYCFYCGAKMVEPQESEE